jgi:hypothetical protein
MLPNVAQALRGNLRNRTERPVGRSSIEQRPAQVRRHASSGAQPGDIGRSLNYRTKRFKRIAPLLPSGFCHVPKSRICRAFGVRTAFELMHEKQPQQLQVMDGPLCGSG